MDWYRHDIPAWMDGTENLSDAAYRAYHVVCQLIYLNEGPIVLNERGIAGRCNQQIRTFRAALKELIEAGKLTAENGKLCNQRAVKEVESVEKLRLKNSKAGQKSSEVKKSRAKPLENNDPGSTVVEVDFNRREEKRLEENSVREPAVSGELFEAPPPEWPSAEKIYFDTARHVLGKAGGSLGAKLLKAKGKIDIAQKALELAATKSDPAAYVGAMLRGRGNSPEDLRARGEAW